MARIVAVAENFAYGPIGKLVTLTKQLLEQGHTFTFIGYGTAFQLGSKEKFQQIIEFNTDSSEFFDFATPIFEQADVLLSAMDRSSVILAQKIGLPTIWIDTLFWWWDEIPAYMQAVDCYIKQTTMKDDINVQKYKGKIRNLHSVGPIVDLSVLQTKQQKNQALIAFGGMEGEGWYKVGVDTNYPYTLMNLLKKQVDFSSYDEVLVTGNERILSQLAHLFGNRTFKFFSLSHERFAQELADSKIVLMVPGLETPLEAFSYGVPTIFLPPSNSSQYVQLNEFCQYGVAEMTLHFDDYYSPLNMPRNDLKAMMEIFLKQLVVFEQDSVTQCHMAKRIYQYLTETATQAKQIKMQQDYLRSLGGNGTQEAIEIVSDFIASIGG